MDLFYLMKMEDSVQPPPPPPPEDLPFLPDDVLVKVFQCLSVPELAAARVVCRRWADVALHKDVWRKRFLDDSRLGPMRFPLRLAPCLNWLRIGLPNLIFDDFPAQHHGRAVVLTTTTRCAAEHLIVEYCNRMTLTKTCAVRNQELLGRLRKLWCLFSFDEDVMKGVLPYSLCEDSMFFIWTACAVEGLTELVFRIDAPEAFNRDWTPVERPRPSLKVLRFYFRNRSWTPIMEHLVDCHAATLEVLELSGPDTGAISPTFLADVVLKVPRLRELDCLLLQDMVVLLRCDKLESLTLGIDPRLTSNSFVSREAKKYLRQATGLRRLQIGKALAQCASMAAALSPALTLDLVETVASSGQSALEVLALNVDWSGEERAKDAFLDMLAVALGRLRALREVCVDVAFDADLAVRLLECLGRVSAAAGRPLTLGLRAVRGFPFLCLHAWLHANEARVRAALRDCPGLHLALGHRAARAFWCCRASCDACVAGPAAGCHGATRGAPLGAARTRAVLYGHPEGAECGAHHHADRSVPCLRLSQAPWVHYYYVG